MGSLWLMYHDVYDHARASSDIPRSSAMYHVSADVFKRQLQTISQSEVSVTTVGQFMSGESAAEDTIALTFDDGWAGAFAVALPLLADYGWRATFFVTLTFMGRSGFCDRSMLRNAAAAGM